MPRPEELLFPTRKERFEDRRKEREQRKLLDEFFDHATLLAISRLVNRGLFLSLDAPISTGKEGGVFRATARDGFRAVKVYRVGNTIFRRLPPYVVDSLRREASERNFARLIFAWTRREYTVLDRLRAAGVRAPAPFGHLRNVLVMEFIGVDGIPSPRLKDAVLDDPKAVYDDLVAQLRKMVTEAHLVHGDLSPYNVLLREGEPVLIDLGQAIESTHAGARALLERDSAHFAKFFQRWGVETSPEAFCAAAGGDSLSLPEG